MKNLISIVCVALALAACGGGGGSSGDASRVSAQALKARVMVPDPTLAAQAVSVVNTTTAGDQVLRSIGALNDGGYTVAWISGNSTLFIQRYDSAGHKVGGETAIAISVAGSAGPCPSTCDPAAAIRQSSIAVLGDGSVVVAYEIDRVVGQVGAYTEVKQGIYIQRFDASGAQLLAETEVFSTLALMNPRPTFLSDPTVRALADGGFVVAWNTQVPALTNLSTSQILKRRYDSQAQPLGGTATAGSFLLLDWPSTGFTLVPDASGGYTLTVSSLDPAFNPIVSAIHYDATDAAAQIAAPRSGSVLLLPLEGDRFVLFRSDSSGISRQFLDSAGNPVGDPVPVSSIPFAARELMDGSFVAFWNTGGNITAQRFDSAGAPRGDLLTLQTSVSAPGIAPLVDGGFAAAWSAPGAAGDLDVFTQRFIEVVARDQAALRAKRKACLAAAKGLRGQERKALMGACLSS